MKKKAIFFQSIILITSLTDVMNTRKGVFMTTTVRIRPLFGEAIIILMQVVQTVNLFTRFSTLYINVIRKKKLSNTPSLRDQCNLILNVASYTASQVVESMIAKITITIAIAAIIVKAFLKKVMKSTLITSHRYNFCLDHSKTIVGSGLSSKRGHYYFNTIQNNRQPKHSIQHSIHNW